MNKSAHRTAVVTLILIFIWHNRALAYIDPGAGSYLFQIIIAGLLGALFMVKAFWSSIKYFLKKIFSRNHE